MLNLVLFGPPGAGKVPNQKNSLKIPISSYLHRRYFRAHIKDQTALGQQVSQIIADGNLVPDSITIAMLEEEINKNPQAKGFIFDGFPRTVAQAEALDKFMESINERITGVLALDVTEEELKQRIAKRQEISGRADDAADKLTKRIEEYFNKTIHVLPYYEAQGKLSKVNGIGDIDAIFQSLTAIIDNY